MPAPIPMWKRRRCGFALFDLMLGVAIFGALMVAALPLLQRSGSEVGARAIAEEMKTFQQAAHQHLLANRAAYEAAMADGTGAAALCKVSVNADGSGGRGTVDTALHTCAVDVAMLKFLSALPASFKARNAYGEQWVAIHRQVYDGTVFTGGVETLVVSAALTTGGNAVTADARRYQATRAAANALGGGGGVVPDTDRETCVSRRASTTFDVCGEGWKMNLAEWISAAQLTSYANRLPN